MIQPNTKQGEFILVAHADPMLMATVQSVLLECGYEVVSASAPEQAIAYCDQNPRVRVVVSDLIFEGSKISGIDLADHARKQCGACAIVTWHHDESLVWGLRGFDQCRYLRRPFTKQQVLAAVVEAWSAAGSNQPPNSQEPAEGLDPSQSRSAGCVRRPHPALSVVSGA